MVATKTPKRNEPESGAPAVPAARLIDERLRSLGGWRGETLALVRRLIHEADP